MSKNKKIETFIYEGLGFPIRLVNAPLKKVFGEWVFGFSMDIFQKAVLHMLAMKSSPLTGKELRFIIDYFEMSYRGFAKIFGVSHVAVVKWEKEQSKMNPGTEIYLRLYILNYLKITDKEFRKLYLKINPENLATAEIEETPLEIDADKIAC
jgi:DNA-binding transcriptional regulator YiaG